MIKRILSSVIMLIILITFVNSCAPTTTEKIVEETAEEVIRLRQELKNKNKEIEELKDELKKTKEDLQSVQNILAEKIEEKTEEAEKEEQKTQEFEIGYEITASDSDTGEDLCSVIIHSIGNYTDYKKRHAPEEGSRYIAIEVEVHNLSNEEQVYSEVNYYLRDADSYKYDNTVFFCKEPDLSAGYLAPGDRVRGWVTIEVPENVTIVEILASLCYLEPPAIIKIVPLLEPNI